MGTGQMAAGDLAQRESEKETETGMDCICRHDMLDTGIKQPADNEERPLLLFSVEEGLVL